MSAYLHRRRVRLVASSSFRRITAGLGFGQPQRTFVVLYRRRRLLLCFSSASGTGHQQMTHCAMTYERRLAQGITTNDCLSNCTSSPLPFETNISKQTLILSISDIIKLDGKGKHNKKQSSLIAFLSMYLHL
jgi:hypothetical protein